MDDSEYDFRYGINAMPVEISVLLLIFVFLFIVGFFGNITVIYRIIKTQRQCVQMYGKGGTRRITLHRYVLLLALVDLLVTTLILMLLPFFFYGQWLIGETLCKFFWIIDQMNKILSIHVLTGMAIERYFIVRHSVHCRRSKAPKLATGAFFTVTAVCLLLLLPLMFGVQIDETYMIQEVEHSRMKSCVSPLTDNWIEAFSVYMLFFGYVVPFVIVTFCYVMLVRTLRQRYQLNQKPEGSKTRLVHRVSKSIIYVTAFHFVCWTPFWLITMMPIIEHRLLNFEVTKSTLFVRLQVLSTALPYVNCSFNWCFYVLLNQRMRRQIFRRSSTHVSARTGREDHSPFFAQDPQEL